MQTLADRLNITTRQLLGLLGFTVILASIPLSFALVKSSQIFRSRASELEKTASSSAQINRSPVTKAPQTTTSPLSDLDKQVQQTPPSPTPPPETGSLNTAFGPTLNVKISLEGRPVGNQAAKVFIGIASGSPKVKPSYTLSFTVDFPASGVFSGLSLAGLNPGSTYTAYLKGPAQIDSAISFVMSPTETNLNNNLPIGLTSGDLNDDNTINSADYTIAQKLYGTTSASSNWNSRADFNADGVINNIDLSYITKNTGKTGSSGVWYSPPPQATGGATLSPGVGGSANGYWFWMPAP